MTDKLLERLIQLEIKRQQTTVNLIPSENYVSAEILAVLGSPLTNKYSEGYPGRRYYPGNKYYDEIEKLAQRRLKKLFKLGDDWEVNVQPYSGSPALLAIYAGLMEPGDILMGLALNAGGHLTHGHRVSFSGRNYKAVQYGVDAESGFLNYEVIEKQANECRPQVIVSGATAYPRQFDFHKFNLIAKKVGAFHVADISHIAGLVAAGLHASPFHSKIPGQIGEADVVVTTAHKTLRGPRAAVIFFQKELAERINRAVFPGTQGGPHNNVIAALALTVYEALQPDFKKYQKQIVANAQALAGGLKKHGLQLVSAGTDNHLMLLDLRNTGLDGKTAEKFLDDGGITANRNTIPGDTTPFNPSGIRMGTPAVTTRGMKEPEMGLIAQWIYRLLIKKEKPAKVKKETAESCRRFPLFYES